MKKSIHSILRWINYGFIVVVLAMTLGMALLQLFSEYCHGYVEQFIGDIIDRKVIINKVTITNRGIEPVIKLCGITIFDKHESREKFSVSELYLGIDLVGSIVTGQVKSNFLSIGKGKITINQDQDGGFTLFGLLNSPDKLSSQDMGSFFSWLLNQGKIEIRDFNLKFNAADGKNYDFSAIKLKLTSGILGTDVVIAGMLKNESSLSGTKLEAKLKLYGDFLRKNESLVVNGDLELENGDFDFVNFINRSGNRAIDIHGKLKFSVKNFTFINDIFRKSLSINGLRGIVNWQSKGKNLIIDINELNYIDDWLDFIAKGMITYSENSSLPVVDIGIKYNLSNLNRAKCYYPAKFLSPNALLWLDKAFVDSKRISGEMVLKGDLARFPFDSNEGVFYVDSKIQDVELNYDEHWPRVKGITGRMLFRNRSMDIQARHGVIMNCKANYIRAIIKDLANPVLSIDGKIEGNSKYGLAFVNASPLAKTIGHKLRGISLFGNMLLELGFTLPLTNDLFQKDTLIKGSIILKDNCLASKFWDVVVNKLEGVIDFDEYSLQSKKLDGMVFDYPVESEINTIYPNTDQSFIKIDLRGKLGVKNLEQLLKIKLQEYAVGEFDYSLALELGNSSSKDKFKFLSNGLGMIIKLPEPFLKDVNQKINLVLEGIFSPGENHQIYVNYADKFSAALEISEKKGAELLSGELIFGQGNAKLPSKNGLHIFGELTKLDWEKWKPLLSSDGIRCPLNEVSLKVDKALYLGEIFESLELKSYQKMDGSMFLVSAKNIDGNLFIPKNSAEPIRGIFKKLHFDANVETEGFGKVNPADLPPLNFEIFDLKYNGKSYGHVHLISRKISTGIELNKLKIANQDFRIDAKGEWLCRKGINQIVLQGAINSDNMGSLVESWGLTSNLVGGNGEINFRLMWSTMPWKMEIQKAKGHLFVNVSNGRIINLDKSTENKLGFSKLLNILSMQSLSKRLILDFSDLSKQGFAFDNIGGKVELSGANIWLKEFILNGPAAEVEIGGKIGLTAKDYDLMLNISPKLTSSIPVAATIAGGPVVGALSFIADKVISNTIKHSDIYKYRIVGSWSKPMVKQSD